ILQHRLLHDVVVHGNAIHELEGARALPVVDPVGDSHHREHQQCGDLHDVDGHVDAGGPRHTAKRDVGHAEGKTHAKENHEEGTVDLAAEGIGEELIQQI